MKTTLLLCFVASTLQARDYFSMDDQFYFKRETYGFQEEIQLGQARVGKINGNYWDVKIPLNRKSWALAIAHGQQLMRNILRIEKYPTGIFLATALKESDLGCDHQIVQEDNLDYPLGKQWDADDGFYQIEGWGASAYGEMAKLYPKRFPAGEENHGKLIGKAFFETATIGKVYYDLMVFHYWKYVKGFRPIELLDNCADEGALIKMLSAAFYMGHQTEGNFYKDIFQTKREQAYSTENVISFFNEEPYKSDNFYQMAHDHAALVHQCVKLFEDSAEVVGSPENNLFYSFYDSLISWNDMSSYIEKLQPLYPDVSWDVITSTVKTSFENVKGGEALSFRYEIAPVIDELILSLPVENPVPGLKKHYEHALNWNDSLEYEPDFGDVSVVQNRSEVFSFRFTIGTRKLHITTPGDTYGTVQLFNVKGQMLQKHQIQGGAITIQTASFSPGIYYLKVQQGMQSNTVSLFLP